LLRQEQEEREKLILSPHASFSKNSKGRCRDEEECPIRVSFQRDRDRIIHAKTFRRLKHKTQVFLSPAGDHYRTRLTHVLEVAQIARTVAIALRLNEHLTEAIALGHDLGHTPFGHAGEDVLNELCPKGFRHYEQSLRVVDLLEKKGKGLNLSHEVRDGILKHSKGRKDILPADSSALPETLEGQIVRIADIIAYVNHDLDDALRAGVIKEDSLPGQVKNFLGNSNSKRIGAMVKDLIITTADVDSNKLAMTAEMLDAINELRSFLYENVYDVNRVHDDFVKAKKIVKELYYYFLDSNSFEDGSGGKELRYGVQYEIETPNYLKVCDYIAGMTDRYALALYTNIFFPKPWSVL
jgi:dGTPase